jgi:flagellar basal-body rod protein FlgF
MDASGYVTLSRQTGLLNQMDAIANNIANASTKGFKREGTIFAEFIAAGGDGPSLSMGFANTRAVDLQQAPVSATGGVLDFAIEGAGFFLVQTPQGQALTRAGGFTPGADGTLQTLGGNAVLDATGSPIFLPPGAKNIGMAPDGTLSADGAPLAKLGLWAPTDPLTLTHQQDTIFTATAYQPVESGRILQGHLEDSNVDPVSEVAKMISVQRAYELGQSFLDREDDRTRGVIQTLGR